MSVMHASVSLNADGTVTVKANHVDLVCGERTFEHMRFAKAWLRDRGFKPTHNYSDCNSWFAVYDGA